MKQSTRAYLYALMAVLFWSTAASAFKLSFRYIAPLELQVIALAVSLIILTVVLVWRGTVRELLACSKRDFFRSAGVALLNPFLYYLVLLKAYDLLPAQEASVLNYVWPITLVLLSIPLLRQRIGAGSILALCISFSGVVIIVTRGNPLSLRLANPLGVCLALGSSILWALFWLLNVRDRRDETLKLFLNFLFGFFYVGVLMVLFHPMRLPPIRGVLGGIYVGLFELGITYMIWLKALSMTRSTAQIGNLVFLSPFLSLVWISLVVGEQIADSTVIGLICIVAGILIQRWISNRRS